MNTEHPLRPYFQMCNNSGTSQEVRAWRPCKAVMNRMILIAVFLRLMRPFTGARMGEPQGSQVPYLSANPVRASTLGGGWE